MTATTGAGANDQVAARHAAGKALRERVPIASLGDWTPPGDRADPIGLLVAQSSTRIRRLVPIRFGRMMASPFDFLRGSAIVMVADLASAPTTGVSVQLCGDAHPSNFGVYSSPERRLVFDITDFDETFPGPWEWDVKRLSASFVVTARAKGLAGPKARHAARAAASAYRLAMRKFAEMPPIDVWYSSLEATAVARTLRHASRRRADTLVERAWHDGGSHDLPKLTHGRGLAGGRRISDEPPLVTHVRAPEPISSLRAMFDSYRASLQPDRRRLLERYRFADAVLKVAGVDSVGKRSFVVLLESASEDPLFLQVKEAEASILEAHVPGASFSSPGERVVAGQRLMQAASDVFLGWSRSVRSGTDYYWRKLRDMKTTIDPGLLDASSLAEYAEACGWSLARAHARSGDAAVIAGYLGGSSAFEDALGRFGARYADQVERDHASLIEAVGAGRVRATPGV